MKWFEVSLIRHRLCWWFDNKYIADFCSPHAVILTRLHIWQIRSLVRMTACVSMTSPRTMHHVHHINQCQHNKYRDHPATPHTSTNQRIIGASHWHRRGDMTVNRRRGEGRAALTTSKYHAHHHHHRRRRRRRRRRRLQSTESAQAAARRCRLAPGTWRHETTESPADDVVARMSDDEQDFHTSTVTLCHTYHRHVSRLTPALWHYVVPSTDTSHLTGLYLSDFHWRGSEFRLALSDYSGHGGCQIGTVE